MICSFKRALQRIVDACHCMSFNLKTSLNDPITATTKVIQRISCMTLDIFEIRVYHFEIKIQSFKKRSKISGHSINGFAWLMDMKKLIFHWSDFFCSGFWPIFYMSLIKKWPEQKKLKFKKISFFLSVNHAKEFLKSHHTVGFFSWPFFETLNFYFKMEEYFCKKNFGSNYYLWLVLWLV